MKIDFVSDVACPWCAVGLNALELALKNLGHELSYELHMQPFELNPTMVAEGVDAGEYLKQKYGMSETQLQAARANLRSRGTEVGFTFGERSRIWNTFDAHRLLHWAGEVGASDQQRQLKHALLKAYHTDGRNPAAHPVLLELVAAIGLDVDAAKMILDSDTYTAEVRQAEQFWQQNGITAVPSVIINDRHLIQGGQPPDVFEDALRKIAAAG
jgi:predicted DsbA family dithiol-disulfide isomerase